MLKRQQIKKITRMQIIPRWMIFCIDLGLINIAFFLAVLIRYDFTTLPVSKYPMMDNTSIIGLKNIKPSSELRMSIKRVII